MQLRSLALLPFAPLALAGCIDALFGPDEPDVEVEPIPEAEQRFSDVYPILAARCGGCHAESSSDVLGFVGKSFGDSYERVLAYPSVVGDFTPNAPILSLPSISHKGVTYTSDERAAIAAWLEAELTKRSGGVPQPAQTVETLLQTWSGCLDYSDFLASNMPDEWNVIVTAGNPRCAVCHTNATGGFAFDSNPMEFFRLISTRRTTLLTFFKPDPAHGVMRANHDHLDAVVSRLPPHNQHPAFLYTGARTALTALTDKTTARVQATPPACSPPRLED
ncbi:MAG TPA: hypothetical protein VNO30_43295 [Kofleriaceae bacterium]|nr:hypothetical protein [Kofleriaceae bacterium]